MIELVFCQAALLVGRLVHKAEGLLQRGIKAQLLLQLSMDCSLQFFTFCWMTATRVTPQALKMVQNWRLQSIDRKSTRLNSSHVRISYAVFCLKKKKKRTCKKTRRRARARCPRPSRGPWLHPRAGREAPHPRGPDWQALAAV